MLQCSCAVLMKIVLIFCKLCWFFYEICAVLMQIVLFLCKLCCFRANCTIYRNLRCFVTKYACYWRWLQTMKTTWFGILFTFSCTRSQWTGCRCTWWSAGRTIPGMFFLMLCVICLQRIPTFNKRHRGLYSSLYRYIHTDKIL